MKVLFTGVVLQPSWPGGEPSVARLLDHVLSAQGIHISKCFVPRDRPRKWSPVNPFASQSVLDHKVVGMYRRQIEKTRPDIVMTWYDYDLSAFWASILSGIPTIAQAQILWPVCPLSCLFNEIDESPCDGPSKSCGFCLAKRARVVGEIRSVMPSIACLPFTQLSMMKTNNIRSKLKYASAIVSDNLFLKKMMAKLHFDIEKVHVIYNGMDLNSIKPSNYFKKPKTVLFLSNQINRQKGFHHFVQVSKNLKPEFPDVRFLWVGQTELGGDTFETQGYVWDKEELQEIFRSSYLLLLPSLWPEAMSYSVIQAMACGKPVVAYNVGANSEGIVHGENGLLAEWGNVEQLSSHVRKLLIDEELAIRMGRNARKIAEEKFSLDRMINSYNSLLTEIELQECNGSIRESTASKKKSERLHEKAVMSWL
jgi:glycosyltransferase involved in cell wall biosynthesis